MLNTVPPFLRHIKISVYDKLILVRGSYISHVNKENNKKDKTTLAPMPELNCIIRDDIWIFKHPSLLIEASQAGFHANRAAESISVVNHT